MEIKEVRSLKDALQRDLAEAMKTFEEATDTRIGDIELFKLHRVGESVPRVEGIAIKVLV